MLNLFLTALLALSMGVFACSKRQEKDHADAEDRGDHAEVHDQAGLEGLTLDNGQKWQMDGHTRVMFGRMADTVPDKDPGSAPARMAMGITLQKQLDELIQGCTMTGDSHDQLHVFLTQYIPAVKNLAGESEERASKQELTRVRGLLQEYTQYFQ